VNDNLSLFETQGRGQYHLDMLLREDRVVKEVSGTSARVERISAMGRRDKSL
jgi:hypothetical protein